MVGDNTHGYIGLGVLSVGASRQAGNLLDKGLEDVGVIIRLLALHNHAEAFKTHASVNVFGLERLKSAVGQAVVLHEHKVPYLNDEGVVLVDEVAARNALFLGGIAQVNVNLAAGTAGTLFAHLPEIVFL